MSTNRRIWSAGFYWIGVVTTLACVALVLAGHTVLGYRLEYTRVPFLWLCAGVAVFAFLAAELCHSISGNASGAQPSRPTQPKAKDRNTTGGEGHPLDTRRTLSQKKAASSTTHFI